MGWKFEEGRRFGCRHFNTGSGYVFFGDFKGDLRVTGRVCGFSFAISFISLYDGSAADCGTNL